MSKFKLACPGCGHVFAASREDHEDIKEDTYYCECCQELVCEDCYEDTLDNTDGSIPYLPKVDGNFCTACYQKAEREFIEKLKQEELPLYINIEWRFDINKIIYKNLLKGVPNGEPEPQTAG